MIQTHRYLLSSILSLVSTACAGQAGTLYLEPTPSDAVDAGDSTSEQTLVASHVQVLLDRITASNAKDWDAWQNMHTRDAVRTAPGLPGPVLGSAAMRERIEELFVTFPDYHLELVDAFGEGDELSARIHTKATMSGPLVLGENTIPATGKTFEQDWIGILRFEGNKIASIDEFYDNYEILAQLGLAQ